jgi:hypothetical protein
MPRVEQSTLAGGSRVQARQVALQGQTGQVSSDAQFQCLSVFVGRTCIGFLLLRGKIGIEAFDADTRSLGLFSDQRSAAAAIAARQGRHESR